MDLLVEVVEPTIVVRYNPNVTSRGGTRLDEICSRPGFAQALCGHTDDAIRTIMTLSAIRTRPQIYPDKTVEILEITIDPGDIKPSSDQTEKIATWVRGRVIEYLRRDFSNKVLDGIQPLRFNTQPE